MRARGQSTGCALGYEHDGPLSGLLLDEWHEDLSPMRTAPPEEPVGDDEVQKERRPLAVVN